MSLKKWFLGGATALTLLTGAYFLSKDNDEQISSSTDRDPTPIEKPHIKESALEVKALETKPFVDELPTPKEEAVIPAVVNDPHVPDVRIFLSYEGQAVFDAKIQLYANEFGKTETATWNAERNCFEIIDMPNDAYTLRAFREDTLEGITRIIYTSEQVDVQGFDKILNVFIPQSIRTTLQVELGTTGRKLEADLQFFGEGWSGYNFHKDPLSFSASPVAEAILPNIPYRVIVTPHDFPMVSSNLRGISSITMFTIDEPTGIFGKVIDAQGAVAQARVYLLNPWAGNLEKDKVTQATTDDGGFFRFDALPNKERVQKEWQSFGVGVIDPRHANAVYFNSVPAATTNLETIVLNSGCTLALEVIGEDHSYKNNVPVQLTPGNIPGKGTFSNNSPLLAAMSHSAQTDEKGRTTFQNLSFINYQLGMCLV